MMMLIPMISKFQSTLPVWGATEGHGNFGSVDGDFNPRSPCGERRNSANRPTTRRYFNPRSPCGERQALERVLPIAAGISIHAPRVGSDH